MAIKMNEEFEKLKHENEKLLELVEELRNIVEHRDRYAYRCNKLLERTIQEHIYEVDKLRREAWRHGLRVKSQKRYRY